MNDAEIVCPTGRPMTRYLAEAIDDLTGTDRQFAIRALSESDSCTLGVLHRALALELRLSALREKAVIDGLEGRSEPFGVEGVPDPPPLTGEPVIFNPPDEPHL